MFRRSPRPTPEGATSIPLSDLPHDTCVRCGRPTPVGVSLCEQDNPGGIGAPSTTQMHGTIVLAIVGAVLLLAVAARFVLGAGPYTASLMEVMPVAEGYALTVDVRNDGTRAARATCRVTEGGLTGPNDLVFITDEVPPGGTVRVQRTLAPGADGRQYRTERLAVSCR